MDRTLQAPAKHHPPSSDLAADADVDADEASRKRARTEARRKFRIVTTTILATNRFRCVIDVEAEQPEQAESEIIAALGALEVQSSSEEMVVDSSSTRNQRLIHSSAGGELKSELNSTSSGSFPIPNEGYCPTDLGLLEDLTVQDDLFIDPRSTHERSMECEEWPYPSLEMSQDLLYYAAGFVGEGDNEMQPSPESGLSDFSVSHYLLPSDSQEEKATNSTEGRELINEDDDVQESGGHEQERPESSEEFLQTLRRIEERSEAWGTLVAQVIEKITKQFQDLEAGSGREKFHQLVEDAREITKKIETPESTSEANRHRNMEAKATPNTLPTIRDTEQRLSNIFCKLEALLKDLSQNFHGRQRQLAQLQSLIKDGRKALEIQKRNTTTVSSKLNTLVRKLNLRELSVEKLLNTCAASITTLVQSALDKEKENFTSVDSVRKWHSDERSSRQSLAEFSSDPYPFLPLL